MKRLGAEGGFYSIAEKYANHTFKAVSKYPALVYGLTALIGFSAGVHFSLHATILLLVLSIWFTPWKSGLAQRFFFLWAVNLFAVAYGALCYKLPSLPAEGVKGTLHFQINSISTTEKHFSRKIIFSGQGKYFRPQEAAQQKYDAYNFPCSIFLATGNSYSRPRANFTYILKGRLVKGKNCRYYFLMTKKSPWLPVAKVVTLAEWRFQQKQAIQKFLFKKIADRRSAKFLAGIMTGQFDDTVMRSEFGKHGLLHLMAISGFHFALLAGFLSFALRLFIPQRFSAWLIVFLMSSYFAFLGTSASVLRAWAMSVITLSGWLLEKNSSSLNTLGASFIIILFCDPLLSQTIGFQFSFGVTASILVFYPLTSVIFNQVMQKRQLADLSNMSSFDQHCYCLISILREGLVLAIAVNIIALPLTLYYFQKFPVLSILYNLFIPFLVGISILLTLVATAADFIFPLLGSFFFKATTDLTHFMLNFIYNTPAPLHVYWYQELSGTTTLAYCTVVFLLGIGLLHLDRKETPPDAKVFI